MRDQYLQNRQIVREDFKDSSYQVEMSPEIFDISGFVGVFSKSFGHTGPYGIQDRPDQAAYLKFVEGIKNKNKSDVDFICNGIGYTRGNTRRLVDPYCIFDTESLGVYRSSFDIPATPDPRSAQAGAELVELYAMSLLREVPLSIFDGFTGSGYFPLTITYNNLPTEGKAWVDKILTYLNIPDIKNNLGAPLDENGNISLSTLFRGDTSGDLVGPYVSQFFYYGILFGQKQVNQQYVSVYTPGPNPNFYWTLNKYDYTNPFFWDTYTNNAYYLDFLKTESSYQQLWNGGPPDSLTSLNFQNNERYILTLRDAAMYIYRDLVWQPFFCVATILSGYTNSTGGPIPLGFRFTPRLGSKFINLGPNDLFDLLMQVEKQAMNACWLWKWSQMKLRPEEMGYQLHLKKKYGLGIDFNDNLLNNPILIDVSNNNNGDFLLSQAYTIGCPSHPAYPSGHAVIAGAMSTIIKSWFNCDSSMNLLIPNYNDPSSLERYAFTTPSLIPAPLVYTSINGEIDKMASNCAIFRNMAGIHYRSDAIQGLKLGENVAIRLLSDWVKKYSDDIIFKFRKRDGTIWEVRKDYSGPSSPPVYYSTPVQIKNIDTPFFPPIITPGDVYNDPNLS